MISRKLGLVGFVVALVAIFGAFAVTPTQRAQANATAVAAGDAIGGLATVTVTGDATDPDVGVYVISTNSGTLTFVSSTAATASVVGSGTGTVTVTLAVPGTATVITLTETCSALLVYTVTAVESGSGVAAVSDTGTCDAIAGGGIPTGATLLATIEGIVVTAPVLEIFPVGISDNDVQITITATNSAGGPAAAGSEVLALATTGVVDSDANIGSTSTCAAQPVGVDATPLQDEEDLVFSAGPPAATTATFGYCVPVGTALGKTTLTFVVLSNNAAFPDIIRTLDVTVVGPAATLTIDASPKTLTCGEKAEVKGTVKDAAGQNVSDGTGVDLWTNFGGVAVPGSSTTTTAGAFTGFLLTSTTNEGPYEVVARVSTGLGYIYAQSTVTCSKKAAAPAPAVGAPATGGGLGAPSTGEAGLADTSGGSSLLYTLAGAVAFALAGVATLRFARR